MIPNIIVDKRELRSGVAKELDRMNASLHFDTIEVGDYVLSDRVGAERKAAADFLKSWLDEKKIWEQLKDLKAAYEKPLLIIEGYPDAIYTMRQIHPNAVQGILISVMVGMHIPIIYTMDARDTAKWLYKIAAREQDTSEKRAFSWHGKRSDMTQQELQEYIISAIPDVGPTHAKHLLAHFGSIEAILTADKEELMKVPKIGDVIASKIVNIVKYQYALSNKDRS